MIMIAVLLLGDVINQTHCCCCCCCCGTHYDILRCASWHASFWEGPGCPSKPHSLPVLSRSIPFACNFCRAVGGITV
uniref:Putative secreted peptide n=1 Tax=Anopheles braziliensis TaxID=58242 RepID=A0A2M3ZWS8_9DIPT